MESYLPNEFDDPTAARSSRAVAHHADTIERIMTPDIGTLIDISSTGAPITRPVGHDPIPPSLHTAQRALREVVERLARSESGISDLNDERWVDDLGLRSAFARSIADAVTTPKPTLAEALGAWPHDDVAGTDHRSIAGQGLSTAATYGNARDLDLIDPSGRNWVPGLASTSNPALPAQLAASDAGISLASLCPDNENGLARLAAFPVASDLAALQVGRVPGVAPAGWSLVRISGSIDSLRSIRFDAGEHNALVDIAHFSIDLRTDRLLDPEPRLVDLHDPDLVWVSSHPLDAHHFAQEAGGHLIVQLAPDLARDVRWVEATVAFRCWRLDRDDSLVATPVLQRADAQRRRVVDGVKRRLQR